MSARYTAIAPFYDVVSGEWPLYRTGRRLGLAQLRLRPGQCALDIGCGTGLNFPGLRRGVGPGGLVVGVDSSGDMLRAAARKLGPSFPPDVRLAVRDATSMTTLCTDVGTALDRSPDAILFTYSLSLMTPWERAWESATSLARPGTRIVVVDMRVPEALNGAFALPARVACRIGGSDIDAHPWTRLASECDDVSHAEAWGGYVQVWAGTWPG